MADIIRELDGPDLPEASAETSMHPVQASLIVTPPFHRMYSPSTPGEQFRRPESRVADLRHSEHDSGMPTAACLSCRERSVTPPEVTFILIINFIGAQGAIPSDLRMECVHLVRKTA